MCSRDTFMFKQHVKVNFASDDLFKESLPFLGDQMHHFHLLDRKQLKTHRCTIPAFVLLWKGLGASAFVTESMYLLCMRDRRHVILFSLLSLSLCFCLSLWLTLRRRWILDFWPLAPVENQTCRAVTFHEPERKLPGRRRNSYFLHLLLLILSLIVGGDQDVPNENKRFSRCDINYLFL